MRCAPARTTILGPRPPTRRPQRRRRSSATTPRAAAAPSGWPQVRLRAGPAGLVLPPHCLVPQPANTVSASACCRRACASFPSSVHHAGCPTALHRPPHSARAGSDDFTLFLWEPSTQKQPLARMTGHMQLINQVGGWAVEWVAGWVGGKAKAWLARFSLLSRARSSASACSSRACMQPSLLLPATLPPAARRSPFRPTAAGS